MGDCYSEERVIRILRIRRSTLKKMEDEGIIAPRERLGERYYTEEQLADLAFAKSLIRDLGVNWAGAVVAVRMRRNIMQIESQMEQIFDYLKRRLEENYGDE